MTDETQTAKLRRDTLDILLAGVAAADPAAAVRRNLEKQGRVISFGTSSLPPVEVGGRILLLSAGKAAAAMTAAAVKQLGGLIHAGSIAMPLGTEDSSDAETLPGTITQWWGGHPVPEMGGMAAAGDALALARSAGPDDLVLCLLSGGASAIWSAPAPGLTLDDLREATEALLRSGAPIDAMNAVRKHLSAIAGGRLAQAAAPARVVTLAISDVIDTTPDAIGSGPTLPDPTTYAQALEVVRLHGVELPPRALRHLQAGAAGEYPDTPKREDLEGRVDFALVLSVEDALSGAAEMARARGYESRIMSATEQGEAREVAGRIAAVVRQAKAEVDGPLTLLWGGETTVTVRGEGRGGRNQELAVAAAAALEGEEGIVLGSMGTDGRDGPTDAAGGIVDGGTLQRGIEAGLDATATLHANDAYPYLAATGDLILIGPTGTNVNDLIVALIHPEREAESG